ncbi:hypothetical protein [Acidocella sp.]|uniref:hypothetical protein n=1 Tax=Acidocella sp. TaxID=50710 RepID=UPI002D7EF21A|nr:hypothetical protein [Acidocella sp.]
MVDKWSAPILKMEENLKHLGAVGAHTNKMMTPHEKLFSHATEGIHELTDRFGEFGKQAGEVGSKIGEILGPLAALGAAGSVAGLVEMTHSFAEATEQLSIGARIAGISVQSMQALNYAALQTGVSTDGMQRSMGMLNRVMGAAATGQNKQALALFQHLHIALRNSHGQILGAADVLPKLADAFAKTSSPAMKALMAQQLFGRAGLELLPMLEQGSAGLAKYQDAFQKYGYTLSEQDVSAAEKFNESWKNMQTSISGLTDDISAKLAPVLTPIITAVADWTAANRDWIATNVQKAIASLSDTLSQVDFKGVLSGAMQFADSTGKLVDDLGGLKTVMIGAAVVMGAPFLAPLASLATGFARLSFAVAGPIVKSIAMFGFELVELVPAMTSVRNAMAALDLVISANPLGAIAIAAIAAGAAAYELYEHWNTVAKELGAVWGVIDSGFHRVFDPIGNTIGGLESRLTSFTSMLGMGGGHGAAHGGAPTSTSNAASGALPWLPPSAPLAVPGAAGDSSKLDVTIHIPAAPAGTRAVVQSSGSAPKPKVNLGHSSMATGVL